MFGSGSRPSLGLSISTSASNAPNPTGAASNQPTGGSLFGSLGSLATSQPQQQGGLFSSPSSQPSQSGGLFGSTSQPSQSGGLFGSTSQPAQSGGLFGSSSQPAQSGGLFGSTSQPAQSGGLFGSTTSQPNSKLFGTATSQPATGGLFGTTASQPASSGGLFGTAVSQTALSGGLFGSASASQSPQGGGLFGTALSQPAPSGLFAAPASQPSQGAGLRTAAPSQPSQGLFSTSQAPQLTTLFSGSNQGGDVKPAVTLNLGQQSNFGISSSGARIDLEHLRPTTKFDQLTEELQREILNLDTAVLNEINRCNEVSNLLPAIAATGSNIANDVAYVTERLEEVETGLENDAEEIQNLKEHIVNKDANEAKVCFKEVDRMKMPTQYQASVTGPATSVSGAYGGHGLSGWWNHPQTLQRSIRGGSGADGSRALQLPGEEDEDTLAGAPTNLVDLFDRRSEEMSKALAENKSLLTEIEEFVASVESKIIAKQQEIMGRDGRTSSINGEEDSVGLLRYVFGEFERSLYEIADNVGAARDGVQELVMGRVGDSVRTNQRLAW